MSKQASMSEDDVQIHVVKLLTAYARPDVCFWHVPNGKKRSKRDGAALKQMGVRAGVSDVHIMVDHKFHVLELKTEIGVVKANQHSFREDLERAGGFFHVAFGLDQAIGVLKGLNVFRPNVTISTANDGNGARSRPWQEQSSRAGNAAEPSPVGLSRAAAQPVRTS